MLTFKYVTLTLWCCGYRQSRDLVVDAVFLFLTCAVQGWYCIVLFTAKTGCDAIKNKRHL